MDENQNNLPEETVSDGAQLTPAEGEAAVDESLSLAELNQFLGTNYKDKPTALASLKETKSFVGKKIEAAKPEADPNLVNKVQSLEEEVFYAQHPEYAEHRSLIKELGKSPAEVVEMAAFKTLIDKAKAADEVTKTKSVVASNSRLAETKTVIDDAIQVANATGSSEATADALAKGVAEEFGIQ